MPKVMLVKKARKAHGQCGKCSVRIERGDAFRWWKFRYGGLHIRCLKPGCSPKPSDLTQSEFYGSLYGIQESIEDALESFRTGGELIDCASALNAAAQELRNLGEECQGKLDNMPEGLQQGDTGQLLENRAQECESKADELESAASEIESAELYDDLEKYLADNEVAREEKETDEDYNARCQEEMDQANETARDEAASNAEVDLSID